MARLHPTPSTSTDDGSAATICRVQVSLLPDNSAALPGTKDFDGRLGHFRNALSLLRSDVLDRIVDEGRLPAM